MPALEPEVRHRSPWGRRHEGADRRARLSAPRARGNEIFADLHARTLHERHGDTVYVVTREHDPAAPEYRVRTEHRNGVTIGWINNTFRSTRSFAETYDNDEITRVAAGLVDAFEPDVAHVHHLTCLSTGIVPLLARGGVPCFMTLHDYWLLCHRGQLLNCDLEPCRGPEPSGCDKCLGDVAGVGRAGFTFAPAWRGLERSVPHGAARTLQRTGRGLARVFGSRDGSAREAARRLDHMRGICGGVTHFFAPSESIRQRHIEFGLAPETITHAPYGFDHRPFRQTTRTPSDTLRIGFLGSLMVSKAPHVLLEAFQRLAPSSVSLELFGDPVAYHGDDSYRVSLTPLMHAPGIRMRGPVPHDAVPAALASLDVLVVPSVWPENSPLVIQEAFLAGVPVVASRIGGIPEVVTDGVNGLLFEPGSRVDLERALRRLLDEPALLSTLRRGLPEVRTIAEDVAFTRDLYSRYRGDPAPGAAADGLSTNTPAARVPTRHVTAVVLNYAAADETVMAVRSLLASRRAVDELVVVDNDTTPECQDLLSSVGPRITYVPTGRNLGFSGGMNVGIRHALERGATDLLLVNSDVIVPPDALGGLMRPTAGIVGPVVMARGEPDRVLSLGMRYHRATGRLRHIGCGERLTSQPAESPVDAVSGCFMLIRREVFEQVGLFDEEYFFSFEDLEFCHRAARAGFQTVLAGRVKVYHEGGRSIGASSSKRLYFAARNHLRAAGQIDPSVGRVAAGIRTASIVLLNVVHAIGARGGSPVGRTVAGRVTMCRGGLGSSTASGLFRLRGQAIRSTRSSPSDDRSDRSSRISAPSTAASSVNRSI